MYRSTKHYGHETGLSCVFRQHRAESHCRLLHGYAIAVKLTFVCDELDDKNWCQDFGGLKEVKDFLKATFDHKLIVAEDDPAIDFFLGMDGDGLAEVITMPDVGCEAFAKYIYDRVREITGEAGNSAKFITSRVKLESVEVMEHNGNSAIYAIN